MKISTPLTLFALLFTGLNANTTGRGVSRQVTITYPQETSSQMLAEARYQIEKAGGEILHDFQLIKGFVVKASAEAFAAFNSILISSSGPQPNIEDDGPVHIVDAIV